MVAPLNTGYPFSLPNYFPVFDQGDFCQQELGEKSLSWRSEKYAEKGRSNVTVFEFDEGKGERFEWDDDTLKTNLGRQNQPQLRIVLLQPTVQEKLKDRIMTENTAARALLLKNRLAVEKGRGSSDAHTAGEKDQKSAGPSQLDISFDALMNLLDHYRIAPAACSHVRGQEQVYGSRLTKNNAGEHESLETWYGMRARAFVPEEVKEADLKVTIITRYHFPSRSTFVLIKYRSFNDLASGLKHDIVQTVHEFVHHPLTARGVSDPFLTGVMHFFPIIQYYRRAARGPRDMVRIEEEKVHDPKASKDIDIRKLHKTLASLDQDNVQLTFILDLIKRLREEHRIFCQDMRRTNNVSSHDTGLPVSVFEEAFSDAVSREFDKSENYIKYFRNSVLEVKGKTERLMDLTFQLTARREAELQQRTAVTQQKLTEIAAQESEAMAMIARITMLFLPGTFVTGILGCNFFVGPENNRPDSKVVVSSQIWILPVAIVLVTCLVFPLFLKFRRDAMKRLQQSLSRDTEKQMSKDPDLSDG